jgi:hypothetical protein
VSPKRSQKVRHAIEQARRAQGRPIDQGDLDREWPRATRQRRVGPAAIIREPAGESVLVLTFADVARSLGVTPSRITAMVDAGELTMIRYPVSFVLVVPRERFELPTNCLEGSCSIH